MLSKSGVNHSGINPKLVPGAVPFSASLFSFPGSLWGRFLQPFWKVFCKIFNVFSDRFQPMLNQTRPLSHDSFTRGRKSRTLAPGPQLAQNISLSAFIFFEANFAKSVTSLFEIGKLSVRYKYHGPEHNAEYRSPGPPALGTPVPAAAHLPPYDSPLS